MGGNSSSYSRDKWTPQAICNFSTKTLRALTWPFTVNQEKYYKNDCFTHVCEHDSLSSDLPLRAVALVVTEWIWAVNTKPQAHVRRELLLSDSVCCVSNEKMITISHKKSINLWLIWQLLYVDKKNQLSFSVIYWVYGIGTELIQHSRLDLFHWFNQNKNKHQFATATSPGMLLANTWD